ncbi:MAG TPA: NBR1-Ig-like domain-containing protein, partial [Anaerolineales bacterium]|nr:NBR1-Ig-like domain-containing protein [Anaerolineales bacterium]
MFHKTLSLVALLTLALSACAAGGTSTPGENQTALPTSTPEVKLPSPAAPTSKASAAPSAAPTAKSNSSGCADSAAFVSDVTVPDNTNLDKSEAFVKTWRVKNTGTCAWTDKYTLVFTSGEQMGAPDSKPLS